MATNPFTLIGEVNSLAMADAFVKSPAFQAILNYADPAVPLLNADGTLNIDGINAAIADPNSRRILGLNEENYQYAINAIFQEYNGSLNYLARGDGRIEEVVDRVHREIPGLTAAQISGLGATPNFAADGTTITGVSSTLDRVDGDGNTVIGTRTTIQAHSQESALESNFINRAGILNDGVQFNSNGSVTFTQGELKGQTIAADQLHTIDDQNITSQLTPSQLATVNSVAALFGANGITESNQSEAATRVTEANSVQTSSGRTI